MPSNRQQAEVNEALAEAKAQAAAYKSLFGPTKLELDNGEFIMVPPHPNLRMMPDDRLEAYENLLFETESYDRADDVYCPEQRLDNGVVIPASTIRGAVLVPHRITTKDEDGVESTQLVKPPFAVRQVKACLGEDDYDKLKRGGKEASDVWRIWSEQGIDLAERERADSFRMGSTGRLAAVPPPNRA